MRNLIFGMLSPIAGGMYLAIPHTPPIWFGLTLAQSQFLAGVMVIGGLMYIAAWVIDWIMEKYFS